MSTIAEKLSKLSSLKTDLAANLNTKGIASATSSMTYNELIPLVLNIETGTSDITDATATSSDLLEGVIAYNNYGKITGTIPSLAATTYTPSTTDQTINSGQYLAGIQTISGDSNLISANIKAGTTIFNVEGNTNVIDTSVDTTRYSAATSSYVQTGHQGFVNGEEVVGQADTVSKYDYYISSIDQALTGPLFIEKDKTLTIHTDANLIPANIASGVTIGDVTGTGKILDTSDATVTSASMLAGVTAYGSEGTLIKGTMASLNATTYTPSTENQTIPYGYYLKGNQTILGDTNLIGSNIVSGVTIFGVEGTAATGTGTDTTDATATSSDILEDKTAYVNGEKITGTISSLAATTYTPSTENQIISSGQYLSGNQTILGDENLIASNIKSGVTIFGITGTLESGSGSTSEYISFDSRTMTSKDEVATAYSNSVFGKDTNDTDWIALASTDTYNDIGVYTSNNVYGLNFLIGDVPGGYYFTTPLVITSSTVLIEL